MVQKTWFQVILVTLAGLALYLPFLASQYDTNGVVEALAVESGQLFHKNHLLYRVIGYAVYRGLQFGGYSGRAIVVLQTMNAICGAVGIGLAYLTYKRTAQTTAALAGTLLFACSFSNWLFSTDVAYITMAGMFASASAALTLYSRSPVAAAAAGLLTALSILTWQASIFLIPALVLLSIQMKHAKYAAIYTAAAVIVAGLTYIIVAAARHDITSVASFAGWFTTYGEGGTLPMWGRWEAQRFHIALGSALKSILPIPLAVPLSQISLNVQLGRIAVDLALVGFGLLGMLAAMKTSARSLRFLGAYLLFLPFIVWWDPFDPKWFFVPNLFFAGFFACALTPWFRNRYASLFILGTLFFMAATNFVTTIGPRHRDVGPDRRMAQCVAENMRPNDLLLAAEWGWPDYLEYLHGRRSLSLISHPSSVQEGLDEVSRASGRAYIPNPAAHSDDHLAWLQSQSGVTREDLNRLVDAPAFSCYGRTIFFVRN